MKIAIVHDYLNQFGGAERVVQELHELFPDAPIYTSICDRSKMPAGINEARIITSFMQNIPGIFKNYRKYFFLYPLAFSLFDLSEFDVILSSSSAYAKGVRKKKGQTHICYCYTPMRFVWRYRDYVKRESFPWIIKLLLPLFLFPIRMWDLATAKRVDHFVAISRVIADRIRKVYKRKSVIIYPPVDCELFQPSGRNNGYFLVCSRLNAYKRIDIVVEAFNKLGLPLKVVGEGPDRERLVKLSQPNIEYFGRLSDSAIKEMVAECQGLVFPGEEDFGIVPVEAMAAGRPVVAFRGGGALETIVDGVTGIFFNNGTPEAIVDAVERLMRKKFDQFEIRKQALKFDKSIFRQRMA
ncbi:MAG: glycosyltransferase, partial [Candidatus Margulisbacteria bacterium]|nr:glycosyltransferase [Candidatus Margulisiibacteriota bacterium]